MFEDFIFMFVSSKMRNLLSRVIYVGGGDRGGLKGEDLRGGESGGLPDFLVEYMRQRMKVQKRQKNYINMITSRISNRINDRKST